MKRQDSVFFAIFGLVLWAAGTIAYRSAGAKLFEGAVWIYWINAVLTAAISTVVFARAATRRKIPPTVWIHAAVVMALPGMLGEIPILYFFSSVMTNLRPETAGPYAGFLFATYACVLLYALSAKGAAAGE